MLGLNAGTLVIKTSVRTYLSDATVAAAATTTTPATATVTSAARIIALPRSLHIRQHFQRFPIPMLHTYVSEITS
jgi:hypothetical protein